MPIHAYTELMCKNDCLNYNGTIGYSGPTYNTGSCIAWAWDSSSGNCWLKHASCSQYACTAPAVTGTSSTETSGMIDPSGWSILQ